MAKVQCGKGRHGFHRKREERGESRNGLTGRRLLPAPSRISWACAAMVFLGLAVDTEAAATRGFGFDFLAPFLVVEAIKRPIWGSLTFMSGGSERQAGASSGSEKINHETHERHETMDNLRTSISCVSCLSWLSP